MMMAGKGRMSFPLWDLAGDLAIARGGGPVKTDPMDLVETRTLRRRIRGRLLVRAFDHGRVRDHHQEVDDGRDDQERQEHVDEVAVRELAVVDREIERAEVRLAADGGDQGRDQVLDEGGDDAAE